MFEPRRFGAGSLTAGASDEARPEWKFEPRRFGGGSLTAGAIDEARPE